jgi:hypothetical protein
MTKLLLGFVGHVRFDPGGRAIEGIGLGRLVGGIISSNPVQVMDIVFSCVGRGLCDELIPRPNESCPMYNTIQKPKQRDIGKRR